jgi:hypothetical protein
MLSREEVVLMYVCVAPLPKEEWDRALWRREESIDDSRD